MWVGIIVIVVALGMLAGAALLSAGAGRVRHRGDRPRGGPIVGWGNDTHLPGN
jgi:hypothetical protein